jgi:hypothetical protein
MLGRVKRRLAVVLAGVLTMCSLGALGGVAPTADAYNVCSDPGAPCTHERMAEMGLDLIDATAEARMPAFKAQIRAGAGHEDEFDHIYGYPNHAILGAAIITMTHFWDADPGDNTPSTYGEFEEPVVDLGIDTSFIVTENALQKSRHFWTLALGSYANGDKAKAYEYLGHIVHFMGDMSVPTHAHGDAHVDLFGDEDPYEEWMSNSTADRPIELTDDEWTALRAAEANPDAGPMNGRLDGNVPAGVDPLYYLLYTTNQLSDFFASRDVDGDTFDRNGWMQAELNSMATTIASPRVQDDLDNNDDDDGPFGEDINNHDGDLGRVRAVTYMYGIRAIAALYRTFEATVKQPTLAVGIDYVKDSDDDADTFDDADFFGKVTINGKLGQNRGEEAVDTEEVVNPKWAYGATVPLAGSVPVHIEILDEDGESPLVPSANFGDDLIDIDPDNSDNDSTLDIQVDMDKCIKGLPGAVTGDVSGTCGQTFETEGGHDPFLGDSERAKVRFRIFVPNLAPVANAGPDVQTPEGTDITLDGSGSFDPEGKPLTYSWDLDGDGSCDDSSGTDKPTFTRVGNDGTTIVKVCVRDDVGLTAEDTAEVKVTNVAPAIEVSDPSSVAENTAVTVAGTIRDPGWLDSLTATIDWGDGSAVQTLTGTTENERPDSTLTFSTSHIYGDNGTYSPKVCAADDDTTPCKTLAAPVTNVKPTAVIDTSGTVSVNGIPTVIAHAGANVDFGARITDPGSDDLTVTWDWGDGTPADISISLVNPPVPDPPLSPSIQPRDISAASDHAFGKACVYTSGLAVIDDDGGSTTGSLNVIIVGNNHPNRPHGYWKQQNRYHAFGTGPAPDFDADTLDCYLKIAGYMSSVFNERTAAATFAQAYDVLDTSSTSQIYELFDQQLLAAWLNFANGAIEWNQLVDTTGDKTADTPFLTAIVKAESLRLNPNATRSQLDAMKRIVERWTNLP